MKEPNSLRGDLLLWFLAFTSIGGLSQISKTSEALVKVFWFALFVSGLAMTLINVGTVYNDFTDNSVGPC